VYEMRRKEKEITEIVVISEIILDCDVCRLGLAWDNQPYVVPVSFGYDGEAIYFHTASVGKKLDYIEANNAVCFEFERGVGLLPRGENPCDWTVSYQSVIGYGRIHELVGSNEKKEALCCIVEHYSDRRRAFSEASLRGMRVWRIEIEEITGTQSEDKRG
jgi:nitroimidazol reductase NimA-like FMN-containing flavoprotein (pyridoxamine 5'-phosphate oxidase superfamily)